MNERQARVPSNSNRLGRGGSLDIVLWTSIGAVALAWPALAWEGSLENYASLFLAAFSMLAVASDVLRRRRPWARRSVTYRFLLPTIIAVSGSTTLMVVSAHTEGNHGLAFVFIVLTLFFWCAGAYALVALISRRKASGPGRNDGGQVSVTPEPAGAGRGMSADERAAGHGGHEDDGGSRWTERNGE